jgi:hypothetical protein
MILFEWDAQKETLENVRTPVCFHILSSSLTSVSIFSDCCYSIVSISVGGMSTTSAFLTHVSTYLGPVRPLAPLMVCNFNKAWCRHVSFSPLMASYNINTI